MKPLIIFLFIITLPSVIDSLSEHYFCTNNINNTVRFTFSSSSHSAWNPATNCIVAECSVTNSTTNSTCLSSPTPCFYYYTSNYIRYCAPAILCSIFEPCDYITYGCSSSNSVCVINSCCSPQRVCLPLSLTHFCMISNKKKEKLFFVRIQ